MASAKGVALITGGAKRLGRAFCEALAEDGYDIAVHYNSSDRDAQGLIDALSANGVTARAFGADFFNTEAVEALIPAVNAEMGPVSVLVNSASIFEEDSHADVNAESFRRHLDANTLAPVLLSKAFAAQAPDGAMIFNLLDYKLFNINADFYSYTISKAALHSVTQMLARALAPRVRVNGVAPGLTLPSPYHSEDTFRALHDDNPLACGPTPEDLVRTLRWFLATPSVSGQIVCVDGGQHFDPRLTRDVFGALKTD
ncbi:MAG: SDR family NAD(P)-dependent oxidoreductase [Oceanicaulis sp.]|uniref:SDR family NAD(P)-dependent oxidoreductase n=1 Tax=Glycocaulis sp. TaxID=1969725 RepID=UPI0025C559B2|nr:SDR family NAD(P)-dependent oxidoreductase [Glycocaulis sp.]MCC5981793.1 SDR family NAD(P)-dependent oxidoreductase [Oceanicaulis sp.]MCH8521468.1 SDR family NAD(P)-dependent oxidoreductase [Glycocaulis sp.]